MKKMLKKATATALSLSMMAALVQLPVKAETVDVNLPEVEIEESILQSDVFYLASTTAKLQEGANERYLLRVARGGDAKEEAGVNIKISDMTAKYGKDYTVSVLGTDEKVENTDDNKSLIEMMEGEDYTQSELKSDTEFYDIMKDDKELQEQTTQAVQDTVDYLEEESGLKNTAPAETGGEVSADFAEVMRLTGEGDEAYPQKLSSSTDTMQQIQQMANVVTDAVVGADLTVDFGAGEKEKYLVIDVKDNKKSDGDRYFFLMLGAPYGSTTNSAASSCAVTIADDEEAEKAQISFDADSYTADGDNLQITVTREGAMNSLAVVQLTAEADTALAGRDFSPVDKELVFPFGITKQTVDIPIRREYLKEDAGFKLKLYAKQNAEIAQREAYVTITPPAKADISLMSENSEDGGDYQLMAERSYTVEDVITGESVDVSKPEGHGMSRGHDFCGDNGWDGDSWDLMWDEDAFWTNPHGTLWVKYYCSPWYYEYAGFEADIFKWDVCANIKVTVEDQTVYDSKNPIGKTNFFMPKNDGTDLMDEIYFENYANCSDCDRLQIKGLKGIYRPFEINLQAADQLEFLNEDGTKSKWADATGAKLSGANNQNNNYIVKYAKDGLNTVSIIQDDTTYARFTGAKTIQEDGYTRSISLSGSDMSDTRSFTMDASWIRNNRSSYNIKTNQVAAYKNPNGTYGTKGVINLKPTFGYKDAKVVVKVPESTNFGYFTISGDAKNTSKDTTYTYHRGDILKLDTVMRDEYKNMYEPTGYKISIKQNESDTQWVKRDIIVPYDDISENRYLNEGKRLKYSYYEITPLFQLKGNAITVRVKSSDVSKFDPSYGFMQAKAVNTTTVGGVEYKDYAIYDNIKNGKIYTVGAKLNASAGNKAYINWREKNNDNVYVGDMFYHLATSNKEDNIITLSVENGSQADMYETLEGTIVRPAYNMRSHDVSALNNTPATGAIVTVGSGYAITDKDGHFRSTPVRAMYGTGGAKRYMRYMISVNGSEMLRDAELTKGKTETEDIFFKEGSDEKKTITVTRQSVSYQNISTENGSVLNNISVYRDDAHVGEGTSLVVDYSADESEVELYAKLDNAPQYTKQTLNSKTGKITESVATENLTEVTFVQYDPDTFTVKGTFEAEKQKDGSFKAKIRGSELIAGYEIYLRATTDRSRGVSAQTVRYDEDGKIIQDNTDNTGYEGTKDGVTYADVFTGYTVVQRGSLDIPVDQTVDLPMDLNFTTLPLVGTTGVNFDFPFVTIGAMKTDTGYRMYLGFNPTSLYDFISGNHATSFKSDTGNYFGDLFSIKSPIKTFKNGITQAYNTAFKGWENLKNAKDSLSSMGAPTWRMSFVFGVYFDFTIASLRDPKRGTENSTFEFTGVGGFIAVNAGFKVAWYTLLPVVFIPAYFGIEIDGSIMGFFGAAADTSKPTITYNEAKEATVDFSNSLEKFHANVKMSATVQVYVGVGLAGTIGLRGGGTFTAMADWDSDPVYVENEWGVALVFTAGIWIDLFLFSVPLQYTFPMIKFLSFKEYDELAKKGVKLQSVDDNGNAVSEGQTFGVRDAFTDKKAEWLPDDGKIELMSAFKQTSQQTIEENGYEHPDTQLIKLSDGSIFMAFLDNDNSRGEVDRTVLKFAVYKNGAWSTPEVVQNDTTGDFQPAISEMDGGKVMIAWVSTPADKRAATDKSQTKDYLNKLEVYTAVIDPATNTVSELTQLTNDTRYDYNPKCVYDDATNDRVVYYSKNFDDNATTEEMANPYGSSALITYVLYSKTDGRWLFDKYFDNEVKNDEDRQTLITNWKGQRFIQPRTAELGLSVVPNIADFDAVSYNGISVYAYTVDTDSNADTIDDRELFVQFYDFETHKTYVPVKLTDDNPQVADAMPQFARTGSGESADTKLFWYRNSKEIAYLSITDLVRNGINDDGTIKDEYMQSKDEDPSTRHKKELSDLYAYVSPISENQHDAVGMADFKPVVDNGNLYIVWTQPETKEDGVDANGETKYKQCREVYATAFVNPDDEDTTEENYIGASWASPYKLTDNQAIANNPAAVIDKTGNLMVVYNTYEQTLNDTTNNTFGTEHKDVMTFSNPKLMASYQVPCGAVDVTDIALSNITPRKDETVEITVDVKNTGLTYADGYTVDVYECNNGVKGKKIDTITSTDKLLPDNTASHTLEWTAPENVDGMSIYTEAHEAAFEDISTYESAKFEKHAVYELENAYAYQDNAGAFKLHATVKNTGNANGAADDKVKVSFVGPYAMNKDYSAEEQDLGSITLDSVEMFTETTTTEGEGEEATEVTTFSGDVDIDGALTVPKDAFEKFGYIDCFAEPQDKDGNALGEGADIRLLASKPVDMKMCGGDIPTEITLNIGETFDLTMTGIPSSRYEELDSAFITDDNSVANVDGNTLTANAVGETTLRGIVNPYNMELEDITVKVTESASEGITVIYDKDTGVARVESSEAIENTDLIFAEYNSDGTLSSVEYSTLSVSAKGAARTNYTVKDKDHTLKVMLWDSVKGMKPLEFEYQENSTAEGGE